MSSTPTSSPQHPKYGAPPPSIAITIIVLICFIIGLSLVYISKCFFDRILQSLNLPRTTSGNTVNLENRQENNLSLDPALIKRFPSFSYESVKDFRCEKYGLECAICLTEFNDEDMLRLLTACYHVFHQECIDLWLGSHRTCPVCRRDLDLPKETIEDNALLDRINNVSDQENPNASPMALIGHAISIAIRENADEEESDRENESTVDVDDKEIYDNAKIDGIVERFSRSHSTGHSIITSKPEKDAAEAVTVDRYTLRLKENVKMKVMSREGHTSAESCIAFGDFSSPKSGGLG